MPIEARPSGTFTATVQGFPTGLASTLGVTIKNPDGSTQTARTTAGIVELTAGSGAYAKANLSAPGAQGAYVLVWDTGGASPQYAVEELCVGATPQSIQDRLSGSVAVSSPVSPDGRLVEIVRGDDYNNSDGRALDFSDQSNAWPDLTGATIVLTARALPSSTPLTVNGSVVVATGAGKKVRVEPTAAQTSTLLAANYTFDVQVTLSPSGRKATLVAGTLRVIADQSA